MGGMSSSTVASRPVITPVPVAADKPTEEKTEALAAEADKIRREYEEKLNNLQLMYEKEQSSKQKLQEELDKLEAEYSDKLDKVQEQYDHVTEAEQIVNDFEKQSEAGVNEDKTTGEAAAVSNFKSFCVLGFCFVIGILRWSRPFLPETSIHKIARALLNGSTSSVNIMIIVVIIIAATARKEEE